MKKQILTTTLTLLAAAKMFALPPLLGDTSYKASSIDNLDINMSWENLQIKEARQDNNILVEVYCNKKKYAPDVKLSSSTLVIDSAPSKIHLFSFERKNCTVIIYLPSGKKFNKTSIRLSSGSLQEATDLSAESIHLQLSSGNINCGYLKAQTIQTISSSGSIKLEGINASDALVQASSGTISTGDIQAQTFTAKTSSGNIKTDSLRSNEAVFSATSGSIKLKDATVQDISLSTTSGGISVDGLLANKISASASSGTIGLELNGAPTKKSSVSATSGTIFISMPKDAAATIRATTASGGFVNAFTKERINSHADYENQINGGGAVLSLSTSSGRITVDVGKGVSASGYTNSSRVTDDDGDSPVVTVDRPIF